MAHIWPNCLLAKGYEVHGVKRRSSSFNTGRIDHIYQDPHEAGEDQRASPSSWRHDRRTNLIRIVQETQPDEIYNLAAQSHVQVSFETPGIHRQCRRDRHAAAARGDPHPRLTEKTRFYQASTSELYGLVQEVPQRESTPFYPRSPYAAAKLYATGSW
jgi:GDPmannose 4,6-dehydratase